MGNNQSQESDEGSERVHYTYHETVLRDAQQLSNSHQGDRENEDQYFSAEEGDSDRSITPPRNRPESSSGEDFSDNSESADEQVQPDQSEINQTTLNDSHGALELSGRTEKKVLTPKARLLALKKSCGQCNVSRFQDHDSIGPELNTSGIETSDVGNSTRASERSVDENTSCDNIDSSQRDPGNAHTHFQPITSSLSLDRSQNCRSHTGSKRKATECNLDENQASPKRKSVIRVSPNKRRLGVLDEMDSDSDSDVVVKRKYGGSIMSPQRRRKIEFSTSSNMKKTKGNEDNISNSFADISDNCGPDLKSQSGIRTRGESKEEKDLDSSQSSNQNTENGSVQENTDSSKHFNSNTFSTRRGSAFQPLGKRTIVVSLSPIDRYKRNRGIDTVKMGNNAVRNSQGKILPKRNTSEGPSSSASCSNVLVSDSPPSFSHPVQTSHSDSSLTKTDSRLSLKKLKVMKPENSETPSNHQQLDLNKNNSNMDPETSSKKALFVEKGQTSRTENSHLSPFHDVVLTPPGGDSGSCSNSTALKRASSSTDVLANSKVCRTQDEEDKEDDPMETDDSQTSVNSETFKNLHSLSLRVFAKAKRSSAVERLKSLMGPGKLKSNLKTFFSQKKSKTDGSPANSFDQSNWSLYSSSSSLFGNSPFNKVQSTSSPINTTGHDGALDVGNFSPIPCSVTSGAPPRTDCQQAESLSSLLQVKRGKQRKLPSAFHQPVRTSLRLQLGRSAASPSTDITASSPSIASGSSDVQQLPQASEFQVLHCRLSQAVDLSVAMGDIGEETTGGIVNCTDERLTHTVTRSSQRICSRAGALMRAACNSYLENKGGVLEPPDVLTTPAGGTFPRSVQTLLHVVAPQSNSDRLAACLLEVNADCLRFANERLGLDSLSLPLIGEEQLPVQLCATAFIDAVLIFMTETKPSSSSSPSQSSSSSEAGFALTSVHLVLEDAVNTDQAASVLQARIDQVKSFGLDQVVGDIQGHYYPSQATGGEPDSPDRTKSGRPRVKRPRL